jgi:hypothetical protein
VSPTTTSSSAAPTAPPAPTPPGAPASATTRSSSAAPTAPPAPTSPGDSASPTTAASSAAPTAPPAPEPPAEPVDIRDLAARLEERINRDASTSTSTDPPPLAPIAAPKGARINDTKTFIHVDLETLRRGRSPNGSICDIDGLGPVDLDWVRKNLSDSFVVLLLKDGPRIIDLVRLGRDATALQRSYKEAQGIHCERPGCDSTHGLELHHVNPWSPTQQTTVNDLAWLCAHDHDLITHHGLQLTRSPDGHWTWTTPTGPAPPQPAPTASAAPPEPGPQPTLLADPGAA